MNQHDMPELQKILSDQKNIAQLMNSQEARALARMLSEQQSGASLQKAARDAAKGNTQQLGDLVRSISSSPEGARLLATLQRALEKQ